MPSVARTLALDHPLYSKAELIRVQAQHLAIQVALSLRALFKNKGWLGAHTVEGSGDSR